MRTFGTLLLSLALAAPAGAATVAGVTLPDKAEVKGRAPRAQRCGPAQGVRRQGTTVGGLYLSQEKSAQKILAGDTPIRMVCTSSTASARTRMCGALERGGWRTTPPTPRPRSRRASPPSAPWMEPIDKGTRSSWPTCRARAPRAGQRRGQGHGPGAASRRHPGDLDRSDPGPGEDFKSCSGRVVERGRKATMVRLYDKANDAEIGTITGDQLQFLADKLEEESAGDDDYYINRTTVHILEQEGGRRADRRPPQRPRRTGGDGHPLGTGLVLPRFPQRSRRRSTRGVSSLFRPKGRSAIGRSSLGGMRGGMPPRTVNLKYRSMFVNMNFE